MTGFECVELERFFQRGSIFDVFFFVDEGIKIPVKSGNYWPISETPFKWRFTDMPMMAQLGSFVIFKGGGGVVVQGDPLLFWYCYVPGVTRKQFRRPKFGI